MSIDLTKYNNHTNTDADKRAMAVSAALTLIQAKATNSPEYGTVVDKEVTKLSHYADLIQEALKVK
ncbi:hypothetical protein PPC_3485 [Pseudomonas protegens Cab57]|uniref:hypothetical protein n=1 Tax=Pseudomonas protegens TaxID=380021 RepID=UPI0004423E38|nr:hypothetical protein [Pseudomonas protegens]BAO62832.1 hypothetical protein PPC_3485 [Pseudomonas protegens Cab57]